MCSHPFLLSNKLTTNLTELVLDKAAALICSGFFASKALRQYAPR